MKRRVLGVLVLALVVAVGAYVWYVHFNYRFETISAGRVYRSGVIPPDRIADYIERYGIRTVIDLRDPGGERDALHPEKVKEIQAEAEAIAKLPGVRHVNIPSRQVPTPETLAHFFEVLDHEENYPVLIHCHHGTGRAQIYSAIYRIEYEGWSNEAARGATRAVVEFLGYRSSFADGKPKGDFLMHYVPRARQDVAHGAEKDALLMLPAHLRFAG
ncbi:MAG: dual specificity protein phosphatase family protein [Thiohalomonadaceae bacterium]